MFWNALALAARALRRNLLRSILTTLGIVIGVAAVITMVTVGDGATVQVGRQIASLGSNLVMVRPSQRMGPIRDTVGAPAFRMSDVDAIAREIPNVKAVAPLSVRSMTAVYGGKNWSTSVTGTTNAYFAVRAWPLAAGREFMPSELAAGRAVCVIGATVQRELFGGGDPLGGRFRLGRISCEVIGVLASKGQTAFGSDQDDVVVMPIRTFWRRIGGSQDIGLIQISAASPAAIDGVQAALVDLLRERRHITANEEDNFSSISTREITQTLTGTMRILTALLSAVAAVSLLVGGIGIMNIMLVSVTERTREIGIRLAIGALERDVLLQFLVESVVLASIGGVIGIVISLAASFFISRAIGVPFVVNAGIMALGFLFAAVVGVVFGFVPARRAARLAPIDALRHE